MLQSPTAFGYAQKLRRERADLVYLLKGIQNGKPAWIYAQIHKSLLPLFEQKLKSNALDISQYGKILYSGWGQEPPEVVKNKVTKDYCS